jgi:AbrB family looped-hinge helix DNA binding protein
MEMRVSAKGQIVIPVELRYKYGLEPGTAVRIVDTGQGILLKPITEKTISELRGILKGTGVLQSLMEERRRDAERGK